MGHIRKDSPWLCIDRHAATRQVLLKPRSLQFRFDSYYCKGSEIRQAEIQKAPTVRAVDSDSASRDEDE